jgi:hypothetical protein
MQRGGEREKLNGGRGKGENKKGFEMDVSFFFYNLYSGPTSRLHYWMNHLENKLWQESNFDIVFFGWFVS